METEVRVRVRPASANDIPRLTEIYNHYIVTTPATFDVEPFTVEQRREWFSHYDLDGPYRVFCAELPDGTLAGSCWSSRFRPKGAYDPSVETSVYCAPEHVGRGIGKLLYASLFAALAGEGLHRAYAGITLPNEASIALHEQFGFRKVAELNEVGRKLGRYWTVAWYERPLD